LDQGHCSVYFEKGFDLVDHNIIVDELCKLQVSPAFIRWIKLDHIPRHGTVLTEAYLKEQSLEHLFPILVNPLQDWNGQINLINDTTALEIVPWCSPSHPCRGDISVCLKQRNEVKLQEMQ
jgi:hypothetical protein